MQELLRRAGAALVDGVVLVVLAVSSLVVPGYTGYTAGLLLTPSPWAWLGVLAAGGVAGFWWSRVVLMAWRWAATGVLDWRGTAFLPVARRAWAARQAAQ